MSRAIFIKMEYNIYLISHGVALNRFFYNSRHTVRFYNPLDCLFDANDINKIINKEKDPEEYYPKMNAIMCEHILFFDADVLNHKQYLPPQLQNSKVIENIYMVENQMFCIIIQAHAIYVIPQKKGVGYTLTWVVKKLERYLSNITYLENVTFIYHWLACRSLLSGYTKETIISNLGPNNMVLFGDITGLELSQKI